MPPYKGNKGNLMQHWTLCEVLRIANRHHSALNYIDAHAMAPLAKETRWHRHDRRFRTAQTGLPGQKSKYELAWQALASRPCDGYPNSANLVRQVWKGPYSLFLCEKDPATYACITDWLCEFRATDPNCVCAASRCGDWRCAFADGLPHPVSVGLPEDALTVISFDPNMYDQNEPENACGSNRLYPSDLTRTLEAAQSISGAVLLQLSTYSDKDNPQEQVGQQVSDRLAQGDFTWVGMTRVNRKMMSLIYARGVPWASCELANLGWDFTAWLP